jgi:P pilus assembly chaperone PapD
MKIKVLLLLMGINTLYVAPSVAAKVSVKALHTISPMSVSFTKSKRYNQITLANKSDKKMYFSFSVAKKDENGKLEDVTEQGYFKAVPHKFILEPGELKKANVFITTKVPEGEYTLHFTPEKTGESLEMANVNGRQFVCDVVVRYSIQAKVTH